LDEAKAIYHCDYGDKLYRHALPWNFSLIDFDAAVNQGQGFEHALHGDDVEMMTERAMYYAETKNFAKYERGWFRRQDAGGRGPARAIGDSFSRVARMA
jgi:lysozyme family protein